MFVKQLIEIMCVNGHFNAFGALSSPYHCVYVCMYECMNLALLTLSVLSLPHALCTLGVCYVQVYIMF